MCCDERACGKSGNLRTCRSRSVRTESPLDQLHGMSEVVYHCESGQCLNCSCLSDLLTLLRRPRGPQAKELVSQITMYVSRCVMAPPIKVEVQKSPPLLNSCNDEYFYMATFKGGRVQRVINSKTLLKVKRLVDLNDTVEQERGTSSLCSKRLGFESRNDVLEPKREKTLAEFVLELKRRKSKGSLATVKWNPPVMRVIASVGTVTTSAEAVDLPVSEPTSPADMVNSPVNAVIAPVAEMVAPVDAANSSVETSVTPLKARPQKDRKRRRSSNELQSCPKIMDTPRNHSNSRFDDEPRHECARKILSAVGRASSDNTGIKVFQRRKVKFKAIRGRFTKARESEGSAGSESGVLDPSTVILICDDLCQCEKCDPRHHDVRGSNAPQSTEDNLMAHSNLDMARPDGLVKQSFESEIFRPSDVVRSDFSESTNPTEPSDVTPEDLLQPGLCVQGPPSPSTVCSPSAACIPDSSTRDSAIQEIHDVEIAKLEPLTGEAAQELPSDIEGEANPGPCLSCNALHSLSSRADQSFPAIDLGQDLRAPFVRSDDAVIAPDSGCSVVRSEVNSSLESSVLPVNLKICSSYPEPPTGHSPQGVNPTCTSTSTELQMAEGRIDALLDTLVIPDDLLPYHLSGSALHVMKTSKTKKRRRSFTEPLALDLLPGKDDSCLWTTPVPHITSLSPDDQEVIDAPSPMEVPQSGLECVMGSARNPLGEKLLSCSTPSIDAVILDSSNEVHFTSRANGPALEVGLGPHPDDEGALRMQENSLSSTGEDHSSGIITLKADSPSKVPESPIKSLCTNETPEVVPGGGARDADDVSTPQAILFSNLKTDSLSKRNRKTFSPNSRLKLIEASRPESARKPSSQLKIKKMKSNLSEACPSKAVCRKIDLNESYTPQVADPSSDILASNEAQDVICCGVEQTETATYSEQHISPLPPGITEIDLRTLSPTSVGPLSSSGTRIAAASPDHKHLAPRNISNAGCTPMKSIGRLPPTQGPLAVVVDGQTGLPAGPCTPIDNPKPSGRPRSILKNGEEALSCRGICKCPRCISTRDQSVAAREFITSQMKLAENITTRLIQEMRSMRSVVEGNLNSPSESATSTSYDVISKKSKGALDSAVKTEDWAIAQILKLSRDSKRVCRLIETGPRRTIFADEAGGDLELVRYFPSKKTTSRKKIASVL